MVEIGSYFHFSDRSGTEDHYLRVFFIHPNGMLWLRSDDKYYEYHLLSSAVGLVQIDQATYESRSFK